MANKRRLIDANALIEKFSGGEAMKSMSECIHDEIFVSALKNAPVVDAVEVVHGRWLDSGRYHFVGGDIAICCSICGCALSEEEYRRLHWHYCPVCGAKMSGGESNEAD